MNLQLAWGYPLLIDPFRQYLSDVDHRLQEALEAADGGSTQRRVR
jgi:hypothetical protein